MRNDFVLIILLLKTKKHTLMKNLEELFEHQLQDLYSAEDQLTKALPKMPKKAKDPKLKKAFEDHLEETKEHKNRLKEICDEFSINAKGETCLP
jgi:ferritin-like metal-binding protein YciE